jgi:hypothetical protein
METLDPMRQPDPTPKPLSAFPALARLIVHEPWLAHPDVRAQCTWDDEGWGGHRFAFYIMRNGDSAALGILIRDGELVHYCRLYPDYALAALDSALWAHEITLEPEPSLRVGGGIDANRRTWSVRVVRRQRRWEVHLTQGGLIPLISDFETHEDADLVAEDWLTVFHHADDED